MMGWRVMSEKWAPCGLVFSWKSGERGCAVCQFGGVEEGMCYLVEERTREGAHCLVRRGVEERGDTLLSSSSSLDHCVLLDCNSLHIAPTTHQ